jgi:hypothetical protein
MVCRPVRARISSAPEEAPDGIYNPAHFNDRLLLGLNAVVDILHVWDLPASVRDDDAIDLQGLPGTVADAVRHYATDKLAAFTRKAQESGITVRSARAVPGKSLYDHRG